MANVGSVVPAFGVLALVGVAVLAAAFPRPGPRAWLWRAVAAGSLVLAAFVLSAGVFVVLFFDATFELFHRLLFAAGSYTFDPARERLVQLFPMAFWSETAIALGIALIVMSLGVAAFALRRLPLGDGRFGVSSAGQPT